MGPRKRRKRRRKGFIWGLGEEGGTVGEGLIKEGNGG
jgi:hypothetical protein